MESLREDLGLSKQTEFGTLWLTLDGGFKLYPDQLTN